MPLIANERTKLLANALDRASTASVAIGVFAPIAASFYGATSGGDVGWLKLAIGAVIWLAAAIALHLAGRIVLGELRP
jgi:hypothetical protein